ncbi:MAG TPA: hemolysin family protein [Candidatus Hydrogenedentes bacterium]|nr:hemolysin family protein [Candidatus Hydrogenedentota bacterium]HOL78128.1 hemolysin family protein [Candidatus Hydrogenedentota bacterium]HPO85584.1 hemolysin family protein [Candidatus Hydrogenedentota bacterium]
MSLFSSLVVFGIAVVLQGLFAGYETGFVSTNPIRIRHLAEEKKDRRAKRLLEHIYQPGRMLTTLLIGTNLAVISGTIAVTTQLNSLEIPGELRELVATAMVAPVFLLFSEIIPKSIFRAHPNRLSLGFLPIIEPFYHVLQPLAAPVAWATTALLKAAGGEERNISALMMSREDLRVLVDESAEQGTIERDEQKMIHSVIDLYQTQAKAIMTPRIDIQALPDTATRDELLALFEESGRTRIPIYHETIDQIIGIIEAHDVLLDDRPEDPDIRRFMREPLHIPDTMKVGDLFEKFKKEKRHIAIVTDEYGGTDGLVTIEDVLEEIFGEIHDEHDLEKKAIQQIGPNAYVVDARTSLDEMVDVIGLKIDDDEVETVGGWVMHIAGRIPAAGEVIRTESFQVTILDAGVNRVNRIRLDLVQRSEGTDVSKT